MLGRMEHRGRVARGNADMHQCLAMHARARGALHAWAHVRRRYRVRREAVEQHSVSVETSLMPIGVRPVQVFTQPLSSSNG